jgi:DNA polymerase/3'-5' exonuclease PolX
MCNPSWGRVAHERSEGRVRRLQNHYIVWALETIATLVEIKDEPYYRVLGYQRAAESVGALGRPVAQVEYLTELPHVGERTAEVIQDLSEDRTPQFVEGGLGLVRSFRGAPAQQECEPHEL